MKGKGERKKENKRRMMGVGRFPRHLCRPGAGGPTPLPSSAAGLGSCPRPRGQPGQIRRCPGPATHHPASGTGQKVQKKSTTIKATIQHGRAQ